MLEIFDNRNIIVVMDDVQHIEKHYYTYNNLESVTYPHSKGDFHGIFIITRHTKWNFEKDMWDNPIWLSGEMAKDFIEKWKKYNMEKVK